MANLLNTRTVTFQELLGIGKRYSVPLYQNDYSWTAEQWEDLWLDVMELQPDSERRHYMGAVVVKTESDRLALIIDGQQRIATPSIFGLAIIARPHELAERTGDSANRERADALRARFIGERDPAHLTEISKLSLNDHDDGFYQDYLVQLRAPKNSRALKKSNKLLWECFVYFKRHLEQEWSVATDGIRLAEMLAEVIARQLLFILISVRDEISAYTVFETLNARGLELTTTDLLKNYLFSRMNAGHDLEAVQRRWQRLVNTVHQERFGEFLRYHYLTRYPQIRTGRLYKLVRGEVQGPAQVLELLDALEDRGELFDALSDSGHALWVEHKEARQWIRELHLFRVKQMTPLLFAAYERFSPQEFERVLRLVVVISFRYTVVSGLNPNELEPVYHEAASAVLSGVATTARDVFEAVRRIYVPDEKFRSDFEQLSMATSGQRKKLVKYMLCRLEQDASGKPIDFETDPGTIEHILPENPSETWEESFPEEKWDEYAYRMGNLTLLTAAENRQLGQVGYNTKMDVYRKSVYVLTRAVVDAAPEAWTLPILEKRQ